MLRSISIISILLLLVISCRTEQVDSDPIEAMQVDLELIEHPQQSSAGHLFIEEELLDFVGFYRITDNQYLSLIHI